MTKILSSEECIGSGVSDIGAKMINAYGLPEKITEDYLKKLVSDYPKFFDLDSGMSSFERELTIIEIGNKVLEDLVSSEIVSEIENKDEFYDEEISPSANVTAKRMGVFYYVVANIVRQKLI